MSQFNKLRQQAWLGKLHDRSICMVLDFTVRTEHCTQCVLPFLSLPKSAHHSSLSLRVVTRYLHLESSQVASVSPSPKGFNGGTSFYFILLEPSRVSESHRMKLNHLIIGSRKVISFKPLRFGRVVYQHGYCNQPLPPSNWRQKVPSSQDVTL